MTETLDTQDDSMLDFDDDDLGLLDDEPWDHHELDEIADSEKSFD